MTNILRLLSVIFLCGTFAAPASAQYLTADDIKRLFEGTSVETYFWDVDLAGLENAVTTGYLPLSINLKPDGTLEGTVEFVGVETDVGKWWTEKNDVFCYRWKSLDGGDKQCARLALQKDGKTIELSRPDGKKFEFDWTIIYPGPRAVAVIVATTGSLVFGTPSPVRPPVLQPRLAADQDIQPPEINVPAAIEAKGAMAQIAGRVSDESRVFEVRIDGSPVTVEADGTFNVRRSVPQGRSTVIIAALDEWGNRCARNVTVTRGTIAARTPAPVKPKVTEKPRPDPFAGIDFGAYHALVIGNNNYRDLPELKTAVNDARAVAKLLTDDYGFSTKLLIDATRDDVISALAKLRAKLKASDNLLIYYAGHGVIDNVTERGYWLPVDAKEAVPTNWVSNDDITAMLKAIRADHIMVVADSCYSGTLVRAAAAKMETARERVQWVKRMVWKRGRTALVSGGLEPVTDSGMGGNSTFARAFLSALLENPNVIDGQTLYQAIKRPVALNTYQTPQYSDIRRAGHDGGDFLFVRKR